MSDPHEHDEGGHDEGGHDEGGHDEGGPDGPATAGVHGAEQEQCGEKAGFLFSHRCRRPSIARCSRCSRPVCDKHILGAGDQAPICVSCGKKDHRRRRGQRVPEYDDSPFFYTSYYYTGYGYYGPGSWGHGYYEEAGIDPSDFSEADGASLRAGGEWDDDFENDMGAS